ncbi:hypothetical protein KKA47_01160 [bacterium]|nr:hypothetical protein [bacterium]
MYIGGEVTPVYNKETFGPVTRENFQTLLVELKNVAFDGNSDRPETNFVRVLPDDKDGFVIDTSKKLDSEINDNTFAALRYSTSSWGACIDYHNYQRNMHEISGSWNLFCECDINAMDEYGYAVWEEKKQVQSKIKQILGKKGVWNRLSKEDRELIVKFYWAGISRTGELVQILRDGGYDIKSINFDPYFTWKTKTKSTTSLDFDEKGDFVFRIRAEKSSGTRSSGRASFSGADFVKRNDVYWIYLVHSSATGMWLDYIEFEKDDRAVFFSKEKTKEIAEGPFIAPGTKKGDPASKEIGTKMDDFWDLDVGILPIVSESWNKKVLALTDIEDRSGKLNKMDLEDAVRCLSDVMVKSGAFSVSQIDTNGQTAKIQKIIRKLRKASYDPQYAEQNRILLGHELAANNLLTCALMLFGETCTLSCNIISLEKGTAEYAGTADHTCDKEGLKKGLGIVIKQLFWQISSGR